MKAYVSLTFISLLVLTGCSDGGVSGTYNAHAAAPGGGLGKQVARYEFSKDGKVIVTDALLGQSVEVTYVVEGDKLTLKREQTGEMFVLTIKDDGSIEGPHGVRLVRSRDAKAATSEAGATASGARKLEGLYIARNQGMNGQPGTEVARYEFSDSGKVIITDAVFEQKVEVDYVVEGDRLKMTQAGQTIVMDIQGDGTIAGPMGIRLARANP